MSDYEIRFNPHQAFLLKNVGEAREDIFLLSKHVNDQIQKVMLAQVSVIDQAIQRWLAGAGPGGHVDELVLEDHRGPGIEGTIRWVLRVKAGPYWGPGQAGAGPVIVEVPGIKLKVVGDE